MNFAIPFSKHFNYPEQDIQWNINYKPKVKQLNEFISVYGTHRINLIITDFNMSSDCQIVQALREKFSETEIVMCLPKYNKQIENYLNNLNLPHYYNEYVTDWDKFQGFLKLNVTDIFVAEDLMFDVKILSLNAKKYHKALRSYCNICESSWDETPSLKNFFIRPEDIDLYKDYIDTFEFYESENSPVRINVLYEIYTKDKQWFGKLREIIVGYEGEEDSRFIIPRFGEKRLNCSKRCMKGIEPICHICDRIIELSNTLKDRDIIVTIDKEIGKNE